MIKTIRLLVRFIFYMVLWTIFSVWVEMSDLLYQIITVIVAVIFVLLTLLNPK
ncbi:hypothetical protein Riean_1725 [Riemerella anatipestifer ATCC 11845 = DSM 15868]|nr:hypothetical protein Riean_1725 [Riemerella anatipestifer ATCC 11845 = DSM 15868]SNV68871.1 Uncharacterised protein [Riemerella anatipestifer]